VVRSATGGIRSTRREEARQALKSAGQAVAAAIKNSAASVIFPPCRVSTNGRTDLAAAERGRPWRAHPE